MSDQDQTVPEQAESARKRRRRSNSPKRNCKLSEENINIILQGANAKRLLQNNSGSADKSSPRFDVFVAVGLFVATVVFIRALPAY